MAGGGLTSCDQVPRWLSIVSCPISGTWALLILLPWLRGWSRPSTRQPCRRLATGTKSRFMQTIVSPRLIMDETRPKWFDEDLAREIAEHYGEIEKNEAQKA